jgi:hypothetical protein
MKAQQEEAEAAAAARWEAILARREAANRTAR